MLRNHYGLAGRRFVAFLLLLFFCGYTASGATIILKPFGETSHIGTSVSPSIFPGGSFGLSASLSVNGSTDRFLLGTGTLDISGIVLNSSSNSLNWDISSLSPGLTLTPTSGPLGAGDEVTLNGQVNGGALKKSGTQNATLTVSGTNSAGQKMTSLPATVVIDPLQPRKLTVVSGDSKKSPLDLTPTADPGGLLSGAMVPLTGYSVTSTGGSNNATIVRVTSVGQVFADTTINHGGTVSVPLSIEVSGMGKVKYSDSASLSVVTGEAASVHDTTNYPSLGVDYKVSAANVGFAATGGPVSGGTVQQFGAARRRSRQMRRLLRSPR